MTITVGQPIGITPPEEGYMPILKGPSFDVIAFFSNLSESQILDWLTGGVDYGVFVEDDIPIFLLDLGNTWTLNVHINILVESEEDQRAFFEGDPNATNVSLTLASYPKTIVQANQDHQDPSQAHGRH